MRVDRYRPGYGESQNPHGLVASYRKARRSSSRNSCASSRRASQFDRHSARAGQEYRRPVWGRWFVRSVARPCARVAHHLSQASKRLYLLRVQEIPHIVILFGKLRSLTAALALPPRPRHLPLLLQPASLRIHRNHRSPVISLILEPEMA
jgi:hypothetical protein